MAPAHSSAHVKGVRQDPEGREAQPLEGEAPVLPRVRREPLRASLLDHLDAAAWAATSKSTLVEFFECSSDFPRQRRISWRQLLQRVPVT